MPLGIASFSLGTSNLNNIGSNGAHLINNSLSAEAQSLGIPVSTNRRQLFRGVFNLDGSLGGSWSWNAYFQHGQSRVHTVVINNVYTPNYNLAVDAVRVTAANVGASGLPIGAIACRSSLTDPANGCQPLDVFGDRRGLRGRHQLHQRSRAQRTRLSACGSGRGCRVGFHAGQVALVAWRRPEFPSRSAANTARKAAG